MYVWGHGIFWGAVNVLKSVHNVTFYFLIYNYYVLFYVSVYDHVFTIFSSNIYCYCINKIYNPIVSLLGRGQGLI